MSGQFHRLHESQHPALPMGHGPPRLLPLDGLRGIAVLLVIWHNAGWIVSPGEHVLLKLATSFTSAGWVGVQVFFALSGFLITGLLLEAKGAPRYYRDFYVRRTLRIFPLYYAFLAATVLLAPRVAWDQAWAESVALLQWPYWLYLSNWFDAYRPGIEGFNHLWSLAVEEQFYLAWPLVVALLSRKALLRLTAGFVLAGPLIRFALRWFEQPPDAAYLLTIARFDAIACGALVATALRLPEARAVVTRAARPAAGALVLGLLALIVWQRGFHSRELAVQVAGQSLVALLSAVAIVLLLEEGPRAIISFQRLLSAPVLTQLGKYSYAMYVFHLPIIRLLEPSLGPIVQGPDPSFRLVRFGLYLLVVTMLSLGAALISWRLIERPFLDLKDRLAPRPG